MIASIRHAWCCRSYRGSKSGPHMARLKGQDSGR
jgi:hypothetical protein